MEIPSINDIVTGNSSKKNINVYDNVSNRVRSVDCLARRLSEKTVTKIIE